MDLEALAKWIAGPAGAGLLAWLGRRRRIGTTIGDFFGAHRNLQVCRSELRHQQESFARQRAALIQQNDDLIATMQVLNAAAQQVLTLRDNGRWTPSSRGLDVLPPSLRNGPTTPGGNDDEGGRWNGVERRVGPTDRRRTPQSTDMRY